MICPGFLMPPLSGSKLEVPGDNHELMDVSIHPSMRIRRQKDWIPLESWLNERIAWIDKDATSIPDAYEDLFFKKIANKVNNNEFIKLFDCKTIIEKDKPLLIWELKDKSLLGRQQVYNFLKDKGYYDLTIKRMIKHFADKEGAHWDRNRTGWISVINSSDQYGSAISVLALHMIYAATKQIKELEDYYTYISPIEIME